MIERHVGLAKRVVDPASLLLVKTRRATATKVRVRL